MPPPAEKPKGNGEDPRANPWVNIEDYMLPRTVVQRLAKGVLPANTQISKDALTAIMKSTTVFVNYLASNANDRAVLDNHKTIKPEDIFESLKDIEFAQFVPRVQQEHDTFVAIANNKRNDYRKKQKDEKDAKDGEDASTTEQGGPDDTTTTNGEHNDRVEDEPPAAKRPRMSDTDGRMDENDHDATEDEEDYNEPEGPAADDETIDDDFADAEETQEPQDDAMDADDADDSNHYRKDADEESEDGY